MRPTGSNVNVTCRKCCQRDDRLWRQYDPPGQWDLPDVVPIWPASELPGVWRQFDLPEVTSMWPAGNFVKVSTVRDGNMTQRKWCKWDLPDMSIWPAKSDPPDMTSRWTIESGVNVTIRMWLSIGPTERVTSMWPTGCDVNMHHRKWR